MSASLSPCPGYQQITEIPRYLLKQVHGLLTCHIVLGVMNESFIMGKHVFNILAVKMTTLRKGHHG